MLTWKEALLQAAAYGGRGGGPLWTEHEYPIPLYTVLF